LAVCDAEDIDTDRTGLFIVRAWLEPGALSPLWVRFTSDVSRGIECSRSFTDADTVGEAMPMWLADMLRFPPTPAD
jgi:hypothetical protein